MRRNLLAIILGSLTLGVVPNISVATAWRVNCNPLTLPDFTTISAALAGGVVDGDSIVVERCAGGYNETVDLSGLSDVHLVAADPGFFGARQEGVSGALPPAPPVVIDGAGLAGSCVRIDGSTDVSVHAFHITHCNGHGVEVSNSGRTLVEGNSIGSITGDAISDLGSFGTRVTGNQARGAIRMEDTTEAMVIDNFATTDASPVVVESGAGCLVHNNYALSLGPTAIHIVSGNGHRVERNLAVGNVNAIVVDLGATDADLIGNDISSPILNVGTATDAVNNF